MSRCSYLDIRRHGGVNRGHCELVQPLGSHPQLRLDHEGQRRDGSGTARVREGEGPVCKELMRIPKFFRMSPGGTISAVPENSSGKLLSKVRAMGASRSFKIWSGQTYIPRQGPMYFEILIKISSSDQNMLEVEMRRCF